MRIGNREFDTDRHTYIMGILNVTPDSFSDGGKWNDLERALRHAKEMVSQGADVIDVGGESTRPGYVQISDEEEIARVVPVIECLKANLDVPISVDTYKSGVARAALAAGADLINDVWGLKYDRRMGEVIAGAGAACCLMHNRKSADYQDFFPDMRADLEETLALAADAGIPKEKILLDPGVGFGKTYEQNLEVIRRLEELCDLDCPILLGTSRKSVIALTLDLPPQERLEGTLATTVLGVMKGAAFVRVHDVKENDRAIRMTEAILGKTVKVTEEILRKNQEMRQS